VTPLDRLNGFVAPGLLRHRTRLPDITVMTDDVAGVRLTRCTLGHGVLDAFQLRVWHDDRVIVGVLLCQGCQRRGDTTEEQVHAMMGERYRQDRYDPGRWSAP
jgi:hypothetical protein